MDLEIATYSGIGPIRLGMSRQRVRSIVGSKFTTFKRTPDIVEASDSFDDEGILVYYKPPGICEAVEVAEPANPIFQGHPLIGRPLREIRTWLRRLDPDLEVDDSGLTSYRLGIAVYSPNASEDPEDPVESVIVFEEGYYGETDEDDDDDEDDEDDEDEDDD